VIAGILACVVFHDGWVTAGWGREPNTGKWTELGAVSGVQSDPLPDLPELTIHNVADLLNSLEETE
jgi:hypothetical protein